MSAKPKSEDAAAEKPEAPAKSEPAAKPEPAPKAAEPTVELDPSFAAGDKVKHFNGTTYEVLDVFPSGIKLAGVANLVAPEALEPVKK